MVGNCASSSVHEVALQHQPVIRSKHQVGARPVISQRRMVVRQFEPLDRCGLTAPGPAGPRAWSIPPKHLQPPSRRGHGTQPPDIARIAAAPPRRAVSPAKVQQITPHDLRIAGGVGGGVNVLALQRMLGHKSVKVTPDNYADLFDDDLDAAAVTMHSRIHMRMPQKYGHGRHSGRL